MNVFSLAADSNRYQNLVWTKPEVRKQMWDSFEGRPMAATWSPVRVNVLHDAKHKGRPASDFPTLGGYVPVFSERAVEALGDLLTQAGELLPLDCDEGAYFALNVLQVIDALDEAQSEIRRFRDGGIMRVARHEFTPGKLTGVSIFKLPQVVRMDTYVTDEFVNRVQKASLTGFWFAPVWSDGGAEG